MPAFGATNWEEGAGLQDRRDHLLIRESGGHLLLRFLRKSPFLIVRNKNRAEVARAFVAKLPLGIDWIDVDPEMIQNPLVGNDGRIIGNLHCLIVARVVTSISRVGGRPARKSGDNIGYTGKRTALPFSCIGALCR